MPFELSIFHASYPTCETVTLMEFIEKFFEFNLSYIALAFSDIAFASA